MVVGFRLLVAGYWSFVVVVLVAVAVVAVVVLVALAAGCCALLRFFVFPFFLSLFFLFWKKFFFGSWLSLVVVFVGSCYGLLLLAIVFFGVVVDGRC